MKFLPKFFSITIWITASFLLLFWPKIRPFAKNEEKTLHILGWGDSIDEKTITSFEKKYHAKIRFHPYGSNEEMLTKMKATGGKGYDILIPSDYAVPMLKNKGLIKELDKTKIYFYNRLNPRLLGHEYDKENRHSIPLTWVVYGFGIDREQFDSESFSYDDIFHPEKRIVMVNDPVEAVSIAAFYLYGPVESLTPKEVDEVKELLLEQKKSVEAYVEVRADYLLATRNCDLALAQHYYLWRIAKDVPHVDFVLPEGEIFISIENIVIPSKTSKDELIYAFLNHIYKKENLINQSNTWYCLPPTEDIIDELEYADRYRELCKELEKRQGEKFHFFRHLIPEEEIRKLWIEVKS